MKQYTSFREMLSSLLHLLALPAFWCIRFPSDKEHKYCSWPAYRRTTLSQDCTVIHLKFI